jgi:hypothetical protein
MWHSPSVRICDQKFRNLLELVGIWQFCQGSLNYAIASTDA